MKINLLSFRSVTSQNIGAFGVSSIIAASMPYAMKLAKPQLEKVQGSILKQMTEILEGGKDK